MGSSIRAVVAVLGLVVAAGRPLGAATSPALPDAVERRDAVVVRALLQQRVDVNVPQGDGTTALHWAARWDDPETAGLLLKAGARVNSKTDLGVTPLWLACQNGSASMVRALLAGGADASAALMSGETMQLGALSAGEAERFAPLIPGLIRATGPISYDYQFGADGLLDRMVVASWPVPATLFSAACVTAATAGDELLGIELGFAGPDFYAFKANLAGLAPGLMEGGSVTYEELSGLLARASKASYLNAHVPDDVYYLHALSAFPKHRGKGIGRALLRAAIERARTAGYRELPSPPAPDTGDDDK